MIIINDRILVFNIPYVYIYMSDKEIDEKLRAIYYMTRTSTPHRPSGCTRQRSMIVCGEESARLIFRLQFPLPLD